LLQVTDLVQEFTVKGAKPFQKGRVSAVAGVSFGIARGETLALVGETGSGKSTIARALLASPPALFGGITLNGRALAVGKHAKHTGTGRAGVQMVFQDPFGALDPRWTVARSITEPLVTVGVADKEERRRRVAEIMHLVGLDASRFAGRLPRELSGGQAQRVAIARALVSEPDLLILDEPVTALDVSVQAQILALLFDLRQRLSLTSLLIAHDLAVVRALADRTAILYLGRVCETAPTADLFRAPAHPYTAALLSAIPPGLRGNSGQEGVRRERVRITGRQPSPLNPPSGCRFRTRCPIAQDTCAEVVPRLREIAPGHEVACHFPLIARPMAKPAILSGAPSACRPGGRPPYPPMSALTRGHTLPGNDGKGNPAGARPGSPALSHVSRLTRHMDVRMSI
jgi:oligopeptide/dipeptide ABC transporter ATP-binding protein